MNPALCTTQFHNYASVILSRLASFKDQSVINRIFKKDHTVWSESPVEITNRLGWLDCPEVTRAAVADILDFVRQIRGEGFKTVLLLGMGGSSLAPEVFSLAFGTKPGYLTVQVLDSTDPGAVLEKARGLNPAETLYIVSTKSGGTVETLSFAKYFYNHVTDALGKEQGARHFAAITDPGSGLEDFAKSLNFRKIFLNDPNIGGRYSALSLFGIVPAALLGIDITALLDGADAMLEEIKSPADTANTAALLGAAMGELALAGIDKISFITSPSLACFGPWVEQLIAESTGKEGKGVLPVEGEPVAAPDSYRSDRFFVYLRLQNEDPHRSAFDELSKAGIPVAEIVLSSLNQIGAEFLRWEMATALSGVVLGIQPFDQPNVESAKIAARAMVKAYQESGSLPALNPVHADSGASVYGTVAGDSVEACFNQFVEESLKAIEKPVPYISLQAYLTPGKQIEESLGLLRTALFNKYGVAVTVGFGPRFLHSTGQLHKGDAGNGVFIQFTADMAEDTPVPDNPGSPDSGISFGILKMAQSLGDREALLGNNRKLLRIHYHTDPVTGISKLANSI